MATGKSFRQTYFGRVIGPAKYWSGNKPYLTFTLYIDGLLVDDEKNRVSGKIGCSYSVQGDSDPVAMILSRIYNKENPEKGGLNGETYKSVEVVVEGTERLSIVKDSDGNIIPGAVYKNLDYCSIQVTDNNILHLYKKHVEDSQPDNSVQRPTSAPKTKTYQKKVEPVEEVETEEEEANEEEESENTYKVGDRETYKGVEYEFTGGDPADLKNWKKVEKKTKVKAKVSPFSESDSKKSKTEKTFKEILEESDEEDITNILN